MAIENQDAVNFVKRWEGKGDEKQHCQQFWTDLLTNVMHNRVTNEIVKFEYQVQPRSPVLHRRVSAPVHGAH